MRIIWSSSLRFFIQFIYFVWVCLKMFHEFVVIFCFHCISTRQHLKIIGYEFYDVLQHIHSCIWIRVCAFHCWAYGDELCMINVTKICNIRINMWKSRQNEKPPTMPTSGPKQKFEQTKQKYSGKYLHFHGNLHEHVGNAYYRILVMYNAHGDDTNAGHNILNDEAFDSQICSWQYHIKLFKWCSNLFYCFLNVLRRYGWFSMCVCVVVQNYSHLSRMFWVFEQKLPIS